MPFSLTAEKRDANYKQVASRHGIIAKVVVVFPGLLGSSLDGRLAFRVLDWQWREFSIVNHSQDRCMVQKPFRDGINPSIGILETRILGTSLDHGTYARHARMSSFMSCSRMQAIGAGWTTRRPFQARHVATHILSWWDTAVQTAHWNGHHPFCMRAS